MRLKHALLASAAGFGVAGTVAGIGAVIVGRELWKRTRAVPGFAGQVVVITGGSRGLGFAIAQEFAARGAKIVICGRDLEILHEAEQRLLAMRVEVLALPCDIAQQYEAENLIRQATERFGRIDVLVNNAGQIAVGPIESQTVGDFQDAMGTMFWGTVYTTMAALPQMIERSSGRIVNITSIGGKVAVPHLVPYCTAKFASVGFSEGIRAELAKKTAEAQNLAAKLAQLGLTQPVVSPPPAAPGVGAASEAGQAALSDRLAEIERRERLLAIKEQALDLKEKYLAAQEASEAAK